MTSLRLSKAAPDGGRHARLEPFTASTPLSEEQSTVDNKPACRYAEGCAWRGRPTDCRENGSCLNDSLVSARL